MSVTDPSIALAAGGPTLLEQANMVFGQPADPNYPISEQETEAVSVFLSVPADDLIVELMKAGSDQVDV